MIHFKCPKCGDFISVDDQDAGSPVTCPACQNVSHVPQVPQAGQAADGESTLNVKLGGGLLAKWGKRGATGMLIGALFGLGIGLGIGNIIASQDGGSFFTESPGIFQAFPYIFFGMLGVSAGAWAGGLIGFITTPEREKQ